MIATSTTEAASDLGKIVERFDGYAHRMSDEYLSEVFGWWGGHEATKENLPYWDQASYDAVVSVGRRLAKHPTVIGATSKMISYVIGRGHTYTITPKPGHGLDKISQSRIDSLVERIQEIVDYWTTDQDFGFPWMDIQEETYDRLIRDGCAFRHVWQMRDKIDITFHEPTDIRQPTSIDSIVNIREAPRWVQAEIAAKREVPGMIGIVHDLSDARKELGYWELVDKSEDTYRWLPARNIQHIKSNVDRNDPRGVPLFYYALCAASSIKEVDSAGKDLALVKAKHAAVYNYDTSTFTSDLRRIAGQQKSAQDQKHDGRPESPGVTHAKGFTVDLPAIDANSRDFIEQIQQQQRFIGGIADMPEFMVTGDANTGNRSSLVAAEGPFDRRVQREQRKLWTYDQPILWMAVVIKTKWDKAGLAANRKRITMNASPPVAASRDWNKEVESEVRMVETEIKSQDQARASLKIDAVQARRGVEEKRATDDARDKAKADRAFKQQKEMAAENAKQGVAGNQRGQE